MAKLFGIEFAPLKIPLERRLQTLAVIKFMTVLLLLNFGSLFLMLYLLLFTRYYFIPLLYLAWYIYDRKTPERGGNVISWVRKQPIWHHYFRDYFPIKLQRTAEFDPKRNYLLGCHPHGIISMGAFGNFAADCNDFEDLYPGMKAPKLTTLAGQFMFPLYRDYLLMMGLISSSKASISHMLSKEGVGNAVVVIIGGAKEALDAKEGATILKVNTRKGFVRMAIQHGASLVPVFSFGENELFHLHHNAEGSIGRRFQEFMTSRLGFAQPIFHGRGIFNYTFGLLPYRHPITTVVGAPIHTEKNPNPSQEEVDKLHSEYLKQLKQLFEDHKAENGVPDESHLVIV